MENDWLRPSFVFFNNIYLLYWFVSVTDALLDLDGKSFCVNPGKASPWWYRVDCTPGDWPHIPHTLWSKTAKNTDCNGYWATRSLAHSFNYSELHALFVPSAALICLLARSLRPLPRSWGSEFFMSQNDLVFSHSGLVLWERNAVDAP